MVTALLLLLASAETGATAVAHASARIIEAEEIDFGRFEENRRDDRSAAAQFSAYQRHDEETGAMRETRLLEFQ